jgi:hypothetical protein
MSMHDQSAQAAGREATSGETGRQYVPQPARGYDDDRYSGRGPTGAAAGFTIMAAVLMILSGMWSFFDGLAAVIKGQFFVVLPNYAYNVSVRGWGWTHLILGAVMFVAGLCLFMDMMWARVVGVILAMASAVLNFIWIPYYPVWSIVIIAIDLFVIWALMVPRRGYS